MAVDVKDFISAMAVDTKNFVLVGFGVRIIRVWRVIAAYLSSRSIYFGVIKSRVQEEVRWRVCGRILGVISHSFLAPPTL